MEAIKMEGNVPEIRLKGFTGAWVQRELRDVADFFNEKRIPIDSTLRTSGEYPYYGATGIIDYVNDYIFDGEYVLLAEDGANIINRNSPIAYLTQGKFWLNNHAHIMKMKNGDNCFLLQLLERQNYSNLNTGTAQPKLNGEVVKKIMLTLPQKEEQIAIGKFFRTLDSNITLHQQKLDGLKNLKKGYLQQMFPQAGETVPKIRLKGFTEPWEERKLGDIAEIVGGGTPDTKNLEYWGDEIDWYTPAEIGKQIYVDGSRRKITTLGLRKSSAVMLPVGTVLFTSRAGIGNTAILEKAGATNQGFQSIVPNKNDLDSYFIFSKTHELKRYGETVGAGSTFIEVSGKQMAVMSLLIPTLPEQIAIGNFFRNLDNQITAQSQKVEQLKQLKAAYLQKMFV